MIETLAIAMTIVSLLGIGIGVFTAQSADVRHDRRVIVSQVRRRGRQYRSPKPANSPNGSEAALPETVAQRSPASTAAESAFNLGVSS